MELQDHAVHGEFLTFLPTRIVFNGLEIEIGSASDSEGKLSPAVVKEKWRRQQILMQEQSNGSSQFPCRFDGQDYLSHQGSSADSFISRSDSSVPAGCRENGFQSQVIVWSGWLSKRSMNSFGGALMRQWRKRWFILALTQGRFSLEYYVEDDNRTCAMKLRRSFLVDQHEAARREWTSSRSVQAYLSVPIACSNRSIVLASPSAAEADFLVASLNALRPVANLS